MSQPAATPQSQSPRPRPSAGKRLAMALVLALFPLALLEVALRLLGIGGSIIYVESSLYGYRPAPSQQFSTMGHPVTILANGFRAPPATNGVLFVGDSVTYGTAYLRDAETFPALLGGHNAGVNGWGPQNIAAFLANEDLSPYSAIVWTLPSCDVLRPFMTLRGGLISTNRRMLFRTEYLLRFLWYGHLRPQPSPDVPADFEPNWEAVSGTATWARELGRPFLLVLLPSLAESQGTAGTATPFLQQARERAVAARIPHLYADPGPDAAPLYRDPVHLSAAGHRWLADRIAAELENKP